MPTRIGLDPEEFKPTEFTGKLSEPMQIDMARLGRLYKATEDVDQIKKMELWSNLHSLHVEKMRDRWGALFEFTRSKGRLPGKCGSSLQKLSRLISCQASELNVSRQPPLP